MKRFTLAVSAIALALGGGAIALATAGPGHDVTRAEAQARAGQLFEGLDVNHDGKLDAADRSARFNAIFDKIDTNHDGQISRDEFLAAHEHMPGMMGPGPEGEEHHHMGADRGPGMASMDHEKWGHEEGRHGHWGHEQWGHPGEPMLVMAILHQADPQHTGTISREAFVNAALSLFDKADTNHDGKVTGAERRAAWAAARDHMRHDHEQGRGPGDMPPPPGL